MPFLCFRNPLPEWFLSAAKDDDTFIKQNIAKYSGKFEERETDVTKQAIKGIAAIHYSVIYHHFNTMRALLQSEYSLTTKETIQIQTPYLPKARAFQLSSGEDILHLALARGHFNMAREILNFNCDSEKSLMGNVDDDGHSHLMILGYFPLNDDIYNLITTTKLLNEFSIFVEGRGFLQVVCYMKRYTTLQLVFALLDKYPQFVESFYIQVTAVRHDAANVNNDMTIFDFSTAEIDYEKCSSAKEDGLKINEVLMQILPQAIKYLQKDMRRFGNHLGEFFKCMKHDLPTYKEDIPFSKFYQEVKEGDIKDGEEVKSIITESKAPNKISVKEAKQPDEKEENKSDEKVEIIEEKEEEKPNLVKENAEQKDELFTLDEDQKEDKQDDKKSKKQSKQKQLRKKKQTVEEGEDKQENEQENQE